MVEKRTLIFISGTPGGSPYRSTGVLKQELVSLDLGSRGVIEWCFYSPYWSRLEEDLDKRWRDDVSSLSLSINK